MKRIIERYIVRDPSILIKEIGRNYETLVFYPIENGQTEFDNLLGLELNDINKTELYVNGQRLIVNEHYEILDNNLLKWKLDWDLSPDDVLVFVWR